MYYVYVLQSLKNQRLYVGYTQDLKRRFAEHNSALKTSHYTSKNGPWKLIFYEVHANTMDARNMEKFYKSGYGREVLKKKLENFFKNSGIV